ncbi:MAG: aminopeptidase P family protein [Candidatus Thorarchaeota archaeon]|nr:aminopeptidase P family protein [Candidatus Thorarchaeota archaeon]
MQFIPQRLDRVHRAMNRDSLDAVILTRRSDVQYLTGYGYPNKSLPACCILAGVKQPVLVVSELESKAIEHENTVAQVFTVSSDLDDDWGGIRGPVFWQTAARALKEAGVQTGMLGLQHSSLTIKEFEVLKSLLPDAGFRDFSDSMWRLRQVKEPGEVDLIRQATRVAEIGLRTALEIITPGKTEVEASIEIAAAMGAAGGELRGIRAAVLSRHPLRHTLVNPSVERIRADSLVVVDITASYEGYFAQVARTLHTGSPSAEERRAYETALEIQSTLEEHLQSGVVLGEAVSAAVRAAEAGSGPPCRAILPMGNSIGLELREPPSLVSGSTEYAREGMVFSLCPLCMCSERIAAKVGDEVLVTSAGCETLSSLVRETM